MLGLINERGFSRKSLTCFFRRASLFIYIGMARPDTDVKFFYLLAFLGLFVLIYHSYRAHNKLKEGKDALINWIHIFFLAPLLFILAGMKRSANPIFFTILLILGIATIVYHGAKATDLKNTDTRIDGSIIKG